MTLQELINYLVSNDVITEYQAHTMDNYSLFVEALVYNGIINYDFDIKEWLEPYYQEHFSKNIDELNIEPCWIQKKYHELVNEGIIKENESEPAVEYPNKIFLP